MEEPEPDDMDRIESWGVELIITEEPLMIGS
jgi:hypothetical protein